jgi:hypothetical protein
VKRPSPWAPHHKLTPADVVKIRRSKLSLAALARKFKVHPRTIHRTWIGESWRSIA